MKLVVGADDDNPIDIGPALAVLRARKSTPAKVRATISKLRLDLFERDQGTCGYASVEAIPHVAELLSAAAAPGVKAEILRLLADLHPASEETDGPSEELTQAIEAARTSAIALLAHTSIDVRVQAARLCAFVTKAGRAVTQRLAVEKDPTARATLLLAAAKQQVKPARAALSDKSPIVRAAAALATVALELNAHEIQAFDAELVAENAIGAVLAHAAADRELAKTAVPFFGGDLREQARRALPKPAESKTGSALDGATRQLLVDAIVATTYSPEKLLREIVGEMRIEAALDLLEDRSDLARYWTYGDETKRNAQLAERRRARMHDLCVQLVDGADAPARVDREIVRLAKAEAKRRGDNMVEKTARARLRNARAIFALARARQLVRGGDSLPKSVVASLANVWGCGAYFRDICSDAVVAHLAEGDVNAHGDALWWLADLSRRALEAVTRLHIAQTQSGWQGVELKRAHVERWIQNCDPAVLEPLFADAAKRTAPASHVVWKGLRVPVDYTAPASARTL